MQTHGHLIKTIDSLNMSHFLMISPAKNACPSPLLFEYAYHFCKDKRNLSVLIITHNKRELEKKLNVLPNLMDNEETESSTPDYMDVLKRIHIRYIPDLRSLRFFLAAMHVTANKDPFDKHPIGLIIIDDMSFLSSGETKDSVIKSIALLRETMSYLSMIARRTLPELPQSQLIIRDMIPTSQESFHYLYESYIQNILVLQGSFDDYDVEVAESLRYLHNPIFEFEEKS